MNTIELFRDWRDAVALVEELEKAEQGHPPLFVRTSDLRRDVLLARKRLAQAQALAEEARVALLASLDEGLRMY